MNDERLELLILGLGNVLCNDDGAGARAVHWIEERYATPQGVKLADGGTLGLSLLPLLLSAGRAILVDAISAEAPSGTLVRLEGDDVAHASMHRLSPHQVGVADLLDGARLIAELPRPLVLLGVVPELVELGLELSPAVAAAVPPLAHAVVEEARALGFALPLRGPHDPQRLDGSRPHVARLLEL
jgi:hydrogenase maturation protease